MCEGAVCTGRLLSCIQKSGCLIGHTGSLPLTTALAVPSGGWRRTAWVLGGLSRYADHGKSALWVLAVVYNGRHFHEGIRCFSTTFPFSIPLSRILEGCGSSGVGGLRKISTPVECFRCGLLLLSPEAGSTATVASGAVRYETEFSTVPSACPESFDFLPTSVDV